MGRPRVCVWFPFAPPWTTFLSGVGHVSSVALGTCCRQESGRRRSVAALNTLHLLRLQCRSSTHLACTAVQFHLVHKPNLVYGNL